MVRPVITALVTTAMLVFVPTAAFAQRIAAGFEHSLIAKPDGTVWAFGDNTQGQLGDNTLTDRKTPIQIPTLNGVTAAAAGRSHSLALTSSGAVWAWGDNFYGQLGDATNLDRKAPVQLASLSSVVAVSAGEYHSVALLANGEVYVWGRNQSGQFGNGGTSPSNSPVLIALGAVAIGTGLNHTLVVKADGSVWAAGANGNGQLGLGSTTQTNTLTVLTGITNVVKAVGGGRHSLFLLDDGSVKAAGYNGSGQLGTSSWGQSLSPATVSISGVASLAAGYDHSAAVKVDGSVWMWGYNVYGQLGDGSTTNRNAPTAVSVPAGALDVALGDHHCVLADDTGTVFTWGRNAGNQLGDGTAVDRNAPEAISGPAYEWRVARPVFSVSSGTYNSDRSVVVTIDAAGATIRYTQNGDEPTESDPVIAAGATIGVTQSLTLKAKAWKTGVPSSATTVAVYNLKVALPTMTPGGGTFTTPQSVTIATTTPGATLRYTTDGVNPSETSASYTSPVAVNTTSTVKGVGFKAGWSPSDVKSGLFTMNFGTLALPSADPVGGTYEGQAAVTLSAAVGATIRYTTNGSEPNTGSAIYTQPLVFATTTTLKAKAFHPDHAASATLAQTYTIRAATPSLSQVTGTFTPGTVVVISSSDPSTTIRITLTGADPTSADTVVGSGKTLLIGGFTLKARAFKAGCVDSEVASATYTLSEPFGPGALSAGGSHSMVSTPSGLLYGWGFGTSGQLGDGGTTNRLTPKLLHTITGVVKIAAGSAHTLAITHDGELFAWGSNGSGRLGDGTMQNRSTPVQISALSNVVAVAAGGSHSLALTADGSVYAWGAGNSGALGLGSTASMSTPTLVPGLSDIVAISAGANHSLAVSAQGGVFAWGANNLWQLGDGTPTMRTSPTAISGLVDVVEVAAGASHSMARTEAGSVYVWGYGANGQLGLGDTANRTTPTVLPTFAALAISANGSHSMTVRADGMPHAWGANGSGQLGDTTTTTRNAPTLVTNLSAVALIAAGATHSVAVTSTGDVWTWGAGGSGQLGDGTTSPSRPTPATVVTFPPAWGSTPEPILSHGPGTFSTSQTVTITNLAADAVMRYTTSGDAPTETDPVIASGNSVAVDGTLTLRVRAWLAGLPASRVVTATYTLKPVTPVIVPAVGPFNASQMVTITTSTAGATIRYTVDGSDPISSSPVYSSPLAVGTLTTLKARAFIPAWTPSDAATAVLSFEYGNLQPPVASSPSGMYPPDHAVTLAAEAGTAIRYTIDGADPDPSSTLYVGPLAFPVGQVLLKARAYRTDWAPSPVVNWIYQITTDLTPPTITAQVSPEANASGWHKSQVQVTYACADADSGVATCPGPVTLSQQGATQVITREAVDNVGNKAAATVLLSVDTSAPILTVHNLEDGAVFPLDTATIEVRGNIVDALSGVNSVTCNDTAASLEGQRYTCSISVGPGSNTMLIVATDIASNTKTIEFGITVSDPPMPIALELTPAKLTLLPGDMRELRVIDERGRQVSGGTFTIADPVVAQVDIVENVPFVRGLSGGETTIVLTRDSLTAQAIVTVLPLGTTDYPNGTVLWAQNSIAPPAGPIARIQRGRVLRPTPQKQENTTGRPPDLFYVEHRLTADFPARAVATTWEGQVLWKYATNEVIKQFAADNRGGLIVLSGGDFPSNSDYKVGGFFMHDRQLVRRLDGMTGGVSWEYACADCEFTDVAIHPDGTVYVVERTGRQELVALDGASGSVRARFSLKGGRQYVNPTAPFVRADGSVVVAAHRWNDYWTMEGEETVLFRVQGEDLTIAETVLNTTALSPFHRNQLVYGYLDRLIPAGDKLLLSVSDKGFVYRLDTNGVVSAPLDLRPDPLDDYPQLATGFVVGETRVHALVQSLHTENDRVWPRVVEFDPDTMAPITVTALDTNDEQYLLHSVAKNGAAWVTGSSSGNMMQVAPGMWAAVEPAISLRVDVEVPIATTEAPYWQGNRQGSYSPPTLDTAVFIVEENLAERPDGGASYTALQYEASIVTAEARLQMNSFTTFFLTNRARKNAFLERMRAPIDAVAFIGHSVFLTEPDGTVTSIGLKFADQSLVKQGYMDTTRPYTAVPSVPSRVPIVFVGLCAPGEKFLTLWPDNTSRAGRALIVPESPTAFTNLYAAARTWSIIATLLGRGATVGEAVAEANRQNGAPELKFKVIGDASTRAK